MTRAQMDLPRPDSEKELSADAPNTDVQRLLGRVPLFQNLPQSELKRLATRMRHVELPTNTILFQQGQPGDRFYIVLEGQLEIFQAIGTEDERILAVRGPGEFIGELSLLNPDGLRTASVRSTGRPAKLWEMTREEFDRLIRRQPSLAYHIAQVLSARMTASQALAIADLEEKNRQLTLAYEELKTAQAQIIEKEKLEHELELAREIQMSILPRRLPPLAGYDFGALMVPARAVGGDLYDFIPLSANRLAIVVGDVTGKGVPAAISMAQIHALLHSQADAASASGEILQRVNRHLRSMGNSSLFATVLYGVLDSESGEFAYARAGHEPPLLVLAEGKVCPLAWGPGQPLGVLGNPIVDQAIITIPAKSTLLLYSDGIIDARNPEGELFGYERLEERLAHLARLPAQQLCDQLWQTLVAYQGDCPQYDDVTLVAVRAAGREMG